jgi:hypothetical protein
MNGEKRWARRPTTRSSRPALRAAGSPVGPIRTGSDGVIVLGNDDGKKMVERDKLWPFVEEYEYVTGVELKLLAAGERPDFVCEKRGRRYGLEVVRAMQNPVDRSWDVIFGRDGQLHGIDAAMLVQDVVYRKEQKRASAGWRYPKSTIVDPARSRVHQDHGAPLRAPARTTVQCARPGDAWLGARGHGPRRMREGSGRHATPG